MCGIHCDISLKNIVLYVLNTLLYVWNTLCPMCNINCVMCVKYILCDFPGLVVIGLVVVCGLCSSILACHVCDCFSLV